MIYAFNFTCNRDADLSQLMASTLNKFQEGQVVLSTYNTDTDSTLKGYGNGSGWPQSMLKINKLRDLIKLYNVKDTEFILSVDSDVVFTSPEVFKYINPQYGIIGIKHRPEYHTHHGQWSHMSGALIFIRGDIAKKIAVLSEFDTDFVRFSHFKPYALTENEDVVLSYLAKFVGANYFDLGTVSGLTSGDFESDVVNNYKLPTPYFEPVRNGMRSFYHLNYCPKFFLDEPVEGKWDIPKVLKMKGIEI